MALPETIAIRYTEEEADNFSVRPVKRQTFRLCELVDMVLRVTGKDPARLQQILRSGTVVYHFYRYWWQGFDAGSQELAALLESLPGDDPGRAFEREDCTLVLVEFPGPARRAVEIERRPADRKPLFAAKSFWDCLLAYAQGADVDRTSADGRGARLRYSGYSFEWRADLYRLALTPEQRRAIFEDARLAPRSLREQLHLAGEPARLVFVSPRRK